MSLRCSRNENNFEESKRISNQSATVELFLAGPVIPFRLDNSPEFFRSEVGEMDFVALLREYVMQGKAIK